MIEDIRKVVLGHQSLVKGHIEEVPYITVSELEEIEKGVLEIYDAESIDEFIVEIQKSLEDVSNDDARDILEKAKKDISKLQKKVITDKTGKRKTVWVKRMEVEKDHGHPSDKHAEAHSVYKNKKKYMSREKAYDHVAKHYGKEYADHARDHSGGTKETPDKRDDDKVKELKFEDGKIYTHSRRDLTGTFEYNAKRDGFMYTHDNGQQTWLDANKTFRKGLKLKKDEDDKKDLMKPIKGKEYQVSLSGSKDNPQYVIEATDGSHQIDMMFDSKKDAYDYIKKRGFTEHMNMDKMKDDLSEAVKKDKDTGSPDEEDNNDFETWMEDNDLTIFSDDFDTAFDQMMDGIRELGGDVVEDPINGQADVAGFWFTMGRKLTKEEKKAIKDSAKNIDRLDDLPDDVYNVASDADDMDELYDSFSGAMLSLGYEVDNGKTNEWAIGIKKPKGDKMKFSEADRINKLIESDPDKAYEEAKQYYDLYKKEKPEDKKFGNTYGEMTAEYKKVMDKAKEAADAKKERETRQEKIRRAIGTGYDPTLKKDRASMDAKRKARNDKYKGKDPIRSYKDDRGNTIHVYGEEKKGVVYDDYPAIITRTEYKGREKDFEPHSSASAYHGIPADHEKFMSLGYTEDQFYRMSNKTKESIKSANIRADRVSILPDGTAVVLKKNKKK